jgi:hypothetical protein
VEELIMDWITIKLMEYQLKKAKKQRSKAREDYVEASYFRLIKSYETAIMFLKANSNN